MRYSVVCRGELIEFDCDLTPEQALEVLEEEQKRAYSQFRADMMSAFKQGRSSDKQLAWFYRLAQEAYDKKILREKGVGGPYQSIIALFNAIDVKRFQIRGQDFQLSKVPAHSVNVGSVYVKAMQGDYLGKINPEGYFCPARPYGAFKEALEDFLGRVAENPVEVALASGRETGVCACCGRGLSDPISVYGSIGPVCLSNLAGPQARKEMERAFRDGAKESLLDVLTRAGLVKAAVLPAKAPAKTETVVRENYESEHDYLLAKALGGLS